MTRFLRVLLLFSAAVPGDISAPPAASAQDEAAKNGIPSKQVQAFLKQEDWYGTFTVLLHGHGSREGGLVEYTVEQASVGSFHISSTYAYTAAQETTQKLLEKLADPNNHAVIPKEVEGKLGLVKREANACRWFADPRKPDGTLRKTIHNVTTLRSRSTFVDADVTSAHVKLDVLLEADALQGFCKLSMGWNAQVDTLTTVVGPRNPPPPQPSKSTATPSRFVLDRLALPPSGAAISGSRPLTPEELRNFTENSTESVGGEVRWYLNPQPIPQVTLRVVMPNYESWLPEPSLDGDNVGKEHLQVNFNLETDGGAAPADEILYLQIHLKDVSREPGIAMNAPLHPNDDDDPMSDLVLPPKDQSPFVYVPPDRTTAVAKNCGTRLDTWIGARDGGAYGFLEATAILKTGRIVDAKFRAKNGTDVVRIPIPKRTLPSKVGDAFKMKYGLTNRDDKYDEDPKPAGDIRFKGDGLSLYEEYRGFVEDGKFFRTDPTKKDLFIYYMTKGRAEGTSGVPEACLMAALERFKKASGLDVHYRLRQGEWQADTRVINFNHSYHSHIADQHALFLMAGGTLGGDVRGITMTPSHHPSNPAGTEVVRVEFAPQDPDECRDGYNGDLDAQMITVIHELGHACNIYHHGEEKWNNVKWRGNLFEGKYGVIEVAPKTVGYPVRVFNCAGKDTTEEMGRAIGEGNEWPMVIGDQNGLFSGDPKCFMCYLKPRASRPSPGSTDRYTWYLDDVPSPAYFCTTANGMFTNDEHTQGHRSHFGHAGTRRGNCLSQIMVTDQFAPPTR
jgi:hypothetical protein